MPTVIVGKSEAKVSWAEYACALIKPGTPVVFDRTAGLLGNPRIRERGMGIFVGSMWWDGISARIKVGDKSVDVFPNISDKVRRVRPSEMCTGPWIGDGI